jgi:hypothetical protein
MSPFDSAPSNSTPMDTEIGEENPKSGAAGGGIEKPVTASGDPYDSSLGQSATGPSGDQSVTGPSSGQSATGPSSGLSATGPSSGQSAPGPSSGQSATGPSSGQSATGPSGGQSAPGPSSDQSATGPSGDQSATGPSSDQLDGGQDATEAMHKGSATVTDPNIVSGLQRTHSNTSDDLEGSHRPALIRRCTRQGHIVRLSHSSMETYFSRGDLLAQGGFGTVYRGKLKVFLSR